MELLRMFHRTTIFCHHWAREGDQMLCVEPASVTAAAAMDAGKKQRSQNFYLAFLVGILLT